jgi:hypothetical protein
MGHVQIIPTILTNFETHKNTLNFTTVLMETVKLNIHLE